MLRVNSRLRLRSLCYLSSRYIAVALLTIVIALPVFRGGEVLVPVASHVTLDAIVLAGLTPIANYVFQTLVGPLVVPFGKNRTDHLSFFENSVGENAKKFSCVVGISCAAMGILAMSASMKNPAQFSFSVSGAQAFATLWGPLVGVALAMDWPGHVGYYHWLYAVSEDAEARRPSGFGLASGARGLGFSNSAPYGFVPIPSLSPAAFNVLSCLTAIALMLAPLFNSGIIYAATFAMFLVVGSHLGQETSIGQHASVPVYSVLFYLAVGCSREQNWTIPMIKVHMASLYLAPGVLKLGCALIQNKKWWSGPSMQQYMFAALFSRPSEMPLIDGITRWIVASPRMCYCISLAGLLFEILLPPLALLYGGVWAVLLAAVAFAFHVAVFLFQGISFVNYWCPALLVFLIDPRPVNSFAALAPDHTILFDGYDHAAANWTAYFDLFRWFLAALYLTAQLVVAFLFLEASGPGLLPWTCMPVFAICTNIFSPIVPNVFAQFGGCVRCAGHVGSLEWKGPHFQDDLRARNFIPSPFSPAASREGINFTSLYENPSVWCVSSSVGSCGEGGCDG